MSTDSKKDDGFREPNPIMARFRMFLTNTVSRGYYDSYVKSLGLKGNERVLEYGSGSGAASQHLARELQKENGHLTCVDISRVWMGLAKRTTSKFNNVDYMLGDIADLNIPPGSYDAVFIHYMLHDIPKDIRDDRARILLNKLKKGGSAFVREPTADGHGMSADEVRAIMAANGLHEISNATGIGPQRWPTFQGIYVK